MKKMLAVFPIIVILIMGNMVAMRAHALTFGEIMTKIEGVAVDSGIDVRELEMGSEDYITKFELDNPLYVWFQDEKYHDDDVRYYLYSYFTYFDEDAITDVGYNEDEACYYMNFNVRPSMYRAYFYFDAPDGFVTSEGGYSKSITTPNSNSFSLGFNTIKYFPETETTEVYLDDELKGTYNSKFIESNVEDFYSSISGLDLSVSFTPTLSGEVDRTIEQNGVQAESNYFSMNITNNSSSNAQFMMAIVPSGSTPTFCGNTDTAVGAQWSVSPIFYLMYKEWVYAPKITGSINGQFKAFEGEYSQSSAWHIVKGNSTYTRNFSWSQINIQAGTSYDVVVLAIPTEFSKPSIVFTQSDCEHYLDTSTGSEVYRSTFTVPNPAKYDSTNNEFGNDIGTTPKGESTKADAYVDENGEVVVEDISASGLLEDRDTWEPGIITKDFADFSFDDIGSILSQSTDFFNFLGIIFMFMPVWFWGIFAFGITALVIIGIVKAIL